MIVAMISCALFMAMVMSVWVRVFELQNLRFEVFNVRLELCNIRLHSNYRGWEVNINIQSPINDKDNRRVSFCTRNRTENFTVKAISPPFIQETNSSLTLLRSTE